jgi:hypothetical protein
MKLSEIKTQRSAIKRRVKKMYNNALPNIRQKSLNWYSEANSYAQELHQKYEISVEKICAVISALSPAVSWEINKTDAENMLEIYVNFGELEDVQFSTYGQNAFKAWEILNDYQVQTFEEIYNKYFNKKTGQKTANFFANILQPFNPNFVTIDRHQLSICKNLKKTGGSQVVSSKGAYDLLKEIHIESAKELGILANQLQAVTWSAFRTQVLGYEYH